MKKMMLFIKGNRDLSEITIKETGARLHKRNPAKFDTCLIRSMASAISTIISDMPIAADKKHGVLDRLIAEMRNELERLMEEENEEGAANE